MTPALVVTAKGTLLEYRAVLRDASGNYSVSGSYGVVGDAAAPAGGGATGRSGDAAQTFNPATVPAYGMGNEAVPVNSGSNLEPTYSWLSALLNPADCDA